MVMAACPFPKEAEAELEKSIRVSNEQYSDQTEDNTIFRERGP